MANTMFNVRIDESLKRQGDAVLRDAGITASAAIRAFYQHIAATKTIPSYIYSPEGNAAKVRRAEALERIASRGDNAFSQLGDSEFDALVSKMLDERYE